MEPSARWCGYLLPVGCARNDQADRRRPFCGKQHHPHHADIHRLIDFLSQTSARCYHRRDFHRVLLPEMAEAMLNWLMIVVAILAVALILGAAKKIAEISGISFDAVILAGAAVVFFVLWKRSSC